MNFNSPFAKDARRGAVAMLLIPSIILLVFSRLVDHLTGVQLDWQDLGRGVVIALFMYILVMRQRYRRYFQ